MKKFLIGAATAAHQVEGNNIYSDCWAQEQMNYSSFKEPSLACVDHYNRCEEDIRLLAEAGLNAYRFSIEWARIEPREGEFSEEEIGHYRKVLECCRQYDIEPIVTLHHFSSPKWLISRGGWESENTVDYFVRYVKFVIARLGNFMHYVCTINEANMGVLIAAAAKRLKNSLQIGLNTAEFQERTALIERENQTVFGVKNPAVFLSMRSKAGDNVIIKAHQKAREAIKEIVPSLQVGLTLSLHDVQAEEGGETLAEEEWEREFLHYAPFLKEDDFIGVQNYTRTVMGKDGALPGIGKTTQMGYEIYPEALENVVRRVYHALKIPVLVTENGIAADDDSLRCEFIDKAFSGLKNCLADGIPIKGYLHWSLLDNFEWQKGYCMKFGLIGVDRSTKERLPKRSLFHLGKKKI